MDPIRRLSAACLMLAGVAACGGGDPADLSTGAVELTTVSSGEDLDADGYTIQVDGAGSLAIGANATTTLTEVSAGDRQLGLIGVRANCVVTGDNPRAVSVSGGETTEVQTESVSARSG